MMAVGLTWKWQQIVITRPELYVCLSITSMCWSKVGKAVAISLMKYIIFKPFVKTWVRFSSYRRFKLADVGPSPTAQPNRNNKVLRKFVGKTQPFFVIKGTHAEQMLVILFVRFAICSKHKLCKFDQLWICIKQFKLLWFNGKTQHRSIAEQSFLYQAILCIISVL